uniref:Fe2OG dioxygenase domain-containing protein n=1 Tax=Aegilops tauschii subsp. strangulata TaxID=200361 RepID=A0A453HEN7_AEGTS
GRTLHGPGLRAGTGASHEGEPRRRGRHPGRRPLPSRRRRQGRRGRPRGRGGQGEPGLGVLRGGAPRRAGGDGGAGAGGAEGLLRAAGGPEGGSAEGRGGAAGVLRVGAHQERQGLEGGVRHRPPRAAAACRGCRRRARVREQVARGPAGVQVRQALEEYAEAMEELAFKLLELIARSLGLRPDRLHGFFKDQTTFIRLNHYPPCPSPDLALGVGRHKDAGALTILYQDDVGGLDVRRRSDGEWVRVRPVPDSYVINVGDIIQVWSNDRYESAEHRVSVNSEKERFSMPYFFNPGSDAMVEPLEEMVSDERPARYDAYNWGNFFSTRKNSNFRKLDVENVQIAHFRKDRP